MAKKSTSKKVVKAAKKVAKKNPAVFVIIVILVIALGVGGYFLYTRVIAPNQNNTSQKSKYVGDAGAIDINFLELGNKYTGDSTFIKAGDVDILIDAGSRQNSATTIANFIDS